MTAALVSLNTKISPEEKALFAETAKAVGLTPSAAIKLFVRKFNEYGGMPFEIRKEPRLNRNLKNIPQAYVNAEGDLIVPASWRDDDDE